MSAQAIVFSCACNCPGVSDLGVTKTVNDPNPAAGASVTFQVVLTNLGPQTATQVVVLDVLPPGLTYTSHTISGTGTYDSVTGRFSVASLASQTSVTLSVTAVVNSCLPVTNCASLSTHDGNDPNASNDSACVTVTPLAGTCADAGGIKFGDQDRNGVKATGEPLIENQTIVLKKGGQIVQTKLTNNAGSYAFLGLLPGTYAITEVLSPGQVVITPSGGSRPVSVTGPASIVGQEFRRVLTQQEIQDIKDHNKCKRPKCRLPKPAHLCKEKQKLKIPFTICNYSGVPESFTWSIAGLPTSTTPKDVTPTNFTPIGGVTPTLNPGQCTNVITKMFRPAGLVAPGVACFQTTFVSNNSGQCYRCKGSVKANDRSCTKAPPPGRAAERAALDAGHRSQPHPVPGREHARSCTVRLRRSESIRLPVHDR